MPRHGGLDAGGVGSGIELRLDAESGGVTSVE